MRKIPSEFDQEAAIETIRQEGVVVMPTDTLYGIVCSAKSQAALSRLRTIKARESDKAFIVLIANGQQAIELGVQPDRVKQAQRYWPGAVSVVLPVEKSDPLISGAQKSIACRLPKDLWLQQLLSITGPLAAPSANPAGLPPADRLAAAKRYFGEQVDLYLDGGVLNGQPSRIIQIKSSGDEVVIRP
jgi:L-threonylcarbamoyladenylate synthase